MKLFDVYPINPIEISHGTGSYIYDSDEIRYLDFYGGHAVISIGHSHPHYIKRITDQLQQLGFYSNSVSIPGQKEFASLLGEVSEKYDYQLFLCNSGAEANENALKLASFYNQRKKIIAFHNGFHGRTSLAVAATDNSKITAPVNETENIVFLPFNDEDALEKVFAAMGEQISSVIIESIQGVGGIQVASTGFLQKIRYLTDCYNAVFIADEVQCGYGRSGKFYALDHAEIQADIYTMAKGMGNGFPIGGISISSKFIPRQGSLGTTFGGNHLACAAALAVLEVIRAEQLIENAEKIGAYLLDELKRFEGIREIRGKGLMIGIELLPELKSVREALLSENRIFTGAAGSNVIRLLPALNITKVEADLFLEALGSQLKKQTSSSTGYLS